MNCQERLRKKKQITRPGKLKGKATPDMVIERQKSRETIITQIKKESMINSDFEVDLDYETVSAPKYKFGNAKNYWKSKNIPKIDLLCKIPKQK